MNLTACRDVPGEIRNTASVVGHFKLSRTLSIQEARDWLEGRRSTFAAKQVFGAHATIPWVPTRLLNTFCWDRAVKNVDFKDTMTVICNWLKDREIAVNGIAVIETEKFPRGTILRVENNEVDFTPAGKDPHHSSLLTLGILGELALDEISTSIQEEF